MKNDLDIANNAKHLPINELSRALGVNDDEINLYGNKIAKIDLSLLERLKEKQDGKLILVTAITPTPFGEGKTTMSIAIADGLKRIGKKVVAALREPSVGPVLGLKGSATGGGYAQIVPRDKINLHFTGDLHAITSAHNFLSAVIDNHIYYGNKLNLNPSKIVWPRTLDVNDRSLRNIETLNRKDNFIITAASEIMAILSLTVSLEDLRLRLSNILIGYNKKGEEVYAKELNVIDTLVVILKDALMPNLVQTLENTPVLVHGGPFANIAHGCNSILATKMALKLGDYTLTEAGFGADLGAEKFIDIKTRLLGKDPDVIVLVSTIRALKYHGFVDHGKNEFKALKDGIINVSKHAENIKKFNVPYIILINNFESDTLEETNYLTNWAKENNHPISFVNSFTKGSIGAVDIAEKIVELANTPSKLQRVYNLEDDLFLKVNKVAKTIYGANSVKYSEKALAKLTELNNNYRDLAICIAKTPLSFSHDPKQRAAASNFDLEIADVRLSRGAGFVVVLTKGIITMPGLPEKPNAEEIFIDKFGIISGKL